MSSSFAQELGCITQQELAECSPGAELPQPCSTGSLAEPLQQHQCSSRALQEHTTTLPANISCAGHNPPNKTTACCLPSLFQIIHLVWFWCFFFSTKLDRANFHIFYRIAERSSAQNLEVLLLFFSHTDNKPIIPSLISILWIVCSFE